MTVAQDETRDSLGLSASMPDTVEVEHLFDMHVDLAPVQIIPSPGGNRMIFVAEGGRVEGERLSGEILPGGGDWLLVGTDRVGRIDVRATIRTDDGELIYMTNTGVIALGDENLARFAEGEDIAWDEGYVRSVPLFETAADAYIWLNTTVTVAINELGPGYVNYRIFSVR
jgi:hypothetical protein